MNKNIFNYFRVAFSNLLRQKSRSILTIIALGIGIAALIIMMATGEGMKQMILGELEIYGSDVVNVEVRVPGKGSSGSAVEMAVGTTITTFKNDDVDAIANLESVKASYSYVTGQEVIKYEGRDKSVMIFGYGADAPNVEAINVEYGRFYTEEEEDSLANVIVLGYGVKDDLFGDDEAVGKNVYIKGKAYKVVGVVEQRGMLLSFDMDDIVYIPTKTMQKKVLGTDYVIGVSVKAEDPDKLDELKEDILLLMRERHDIDDPDKDDFEVMTMVEAAEMTESVMQSINILLIALAVISLLVGGIGIMNIMFVSVAERTFEIGLRRSVGAKKKDILYQFLLEAIILTFFGGVLGIILGSIISLIVYFIAVGVGLKWVYAISPLSIIIALLFSTSIGLFFGVYPAKEASELDPIGAIRKE